MMLHEMSTAMDMALGAANGTAHALVGLSVHASETYEYAPDLESAMEFKGHPFIWNKDFKSCSFSGVMVPFSRTWEVMTMRDGREEVSMPGPDTLLGHAIILNRVQCADSPPEKILRLGTEPRSWGFQRMVENKMVITFDLNEMTPEHLPPWLPQVMARLDRLARHPRTVQAVKDFVHDTKGEFAASRHRLGILK